MDIVNDIWTSIFPKIDWVSVLIVVSVGYLVTKTSLFSKKNLNKSFKILLVAAPCVGIYAITGGISFAAAFGGLVVAFGLHGLVLKPLESAIKSIGGGGTSDPTGNGR